jgi:hypothetical protein
MESSLQPMQFMLGEKFQSLQIILEIVHQPMQVMLEASHQPLQDPGGYRHAGHPPFPTGSKQFSGNFGNLLFLAVFNFQGHFEGLNEGFLGSILNDSQRL